MRWTRMQKIDLGFSSSLVWLVVDHLQKHKGEKVDAEHVDNTKPWEVNTRIGVGNNTLTYRHLSKEQFLTYLGKQEEDINTKNGEC